MKIKNIKIKNFKSIGNKEVFIDLKDGLHLIKGVPGTGKTTLLSAITFCLYGKSSDFKGTTKTTLATSELINDINKKEMLVEIQIGDYIIRRGLKPSIFEILDKDGKNLAEYSSKTIDQQFLEDNILQGLTIDIFLNTVYLSSKPASVPFIYMSNTQRKDYIEKILDLSIINNMNEHLKSYISTNKLELNTIETKKVMLQQQLDLEIKKYDEALFNYERLLKQKEDFEKEKDEKILFYTQQIKDLEKENKVTDKEIVDINNKIENIEQTYLNSDVLKKEVHDFKIKALDKVDEFKSLIKEKEDNINNLKTYLEEKFKNVIEDLDTELSGLIFKEDMIEGDINNIPIDDNDYKEILTNLKTAVDENEISIKQIKENIQELNKAIDKKEFEKESFLKQKENFKICGECPTVNKLIGDFDLEKIDSFIGTAKLHLASNQKALEEKEENLKNLSMNFNINITKKNEQDKNIMDKTNLLLEQSKIKSRIETIRFELTDIDNKKEKEENNIKEERNSLNEKLSTFKLSVNDKIKDIEENFKNRLLTSFKNELNEFKTKKSNILDKININNNIIIEIKSKVFNLQEKPNINYVEDVQKNIDNITKEYETLYNQSVELSDLKKIINDKKIKEDAFKKILPVFESKLNNMLDRFMVDDEFTIKASLNADFNLEFKKNGKSINLFSLSQGQQSCVSIATTFSFLHLLSIKHSNNLNMLFIDEILDTSISHRIVPITHYLKELSLEKPVYIISHSTLIPTELFDSITTVEKENSFSIYNIERS